MKYFGYPDPASGGGVGLFSDKKCKVVQYQLCRESSREEQVHCGGGCRSYGGKGWELSFLNLEYPGLAWWVNEVVQTWITESRTLKEWNMTRSDDILEEEVKVCKPVTHADIIAKEEFAAQANSFRTPLEKRNVNVLSEPAYL
eukprot:scaffold421213_cov65-Attheya_sp.AAC.2